MTTLRVVDELVADLQSMLTIATPVIWSIAAFVGTSVATIRLMRRRQLTSTTVAISSFTKEQVMAKRKKHFAKALSISYENTDPLMIVKGKGSRLYDENGLSYLDTRNNVAHCGHGHPKVSAAVQAQVAEINTNTRYLHPNMVALAEKLSSLLPDPLDVVFFCNSGSEANDLALRLARAYSRSNNTIVVDRAYHGHTMKVLEVSPYKYEHGTEFKLIQPDSARSFQSPGSHIYKVPCPDTYRGEFRDPLTAGAQYASYVESACRFYRSRGERVSAFIIEGGMSVAGVILPPSGYLSACAESVRRAGGLLVADEVQTGFGRLGSSYWAFLNQNEASDPIVVPDIVTVGKPFGNGMPLSAVITSRTVADQFDALGVELFNTFGGNPVCTAAGLAVLDAIEEEQLQQQALEVGRYLASNLRKLSERLDIIGDVRGSGLFLGIELVLDRKTLEPATLETSFICSTLKTKYQILTSIDGPFGNVIVIKPPMVFSVGDADYFVDSFEKAIGDLSQCDSLDAAQQSKTPT